MADGDGDIGEVGPGAMLHAQQHLGHTLVVSTGSGPCGPVDLDSGTVTIGVDVPPAVLPPRPAVREDGAEDEGTG
jgi:hypothetical protein